MWLRIFHSILTRILYELSSEKTTHSNPNSIPGQFLRSHSRPRIFRLCYARFQRQARRCTLSVSPVLLLEQGYGHCNRIGIFQGAEWCLGLVVLYINEIQADPQSSVPAPASFRTKYGFLQNALQNIMYNMLTHTIYCGTLHCVIDSLCVPHFEGKSVDL